MGKQECLRTHAVTGHSIHKTTRHYCEHKKLMQVKKVRTSRVVTKNTHVFKGITKITFELLTIQGSVDLSSVDMDMCRMYM